MNQVRRLYYLENDRYHSIRYDYASGDNYYKIDAQLIARLLKQRKPAFQHYYVRRDNLFCKAINIQFFKKEYVQNYLNKCLDVIATLKEVSPA